jgi:16S rRNA (uracil1498-N3)-methyltransferase
MPIMDPSPARAPRLYCDGVLSPGATVRLSERAARHLAALRLEVGDQVTLFNGDGFESSALVAEIGKRGAAATVKRRDAADRESPLVVRLAQGVCAADRMDLVLQKATELGVESILPVTTMRSIVRLPPERRARRETHWQNVVIAACEQCGRNRIPKVEVTTSFPQFVADVPREGTRILLSPDGEIGFRELRVSAPVCVLIGPEGGLAPEEREMVALAGFVPVRFGPRVLRTETAPLAALAALQALYGDC